MPFEEWLSWVLNNEQVFIDYLMVGLVANFALAFISLLSGIKAPYGRYSAGGVWGCMIPGKVAWVVQEVPNLIWAAVCFWGLEGNEKAKQGFANKSLLLMFTAHYFNRTFVFPMRLRGGKPTPFVPFILATVFCTLNGYLQARTLTTFLEYPSDWATSPQFMIGTTVFLVGMRINHTADITLINLRKPGETGYKIPRGGMFEYVSGANFFGEIVEWTGFAIASWSRPAAVFALATALNIGPRALHHHQWYLEKFREEYPKQRKALIPFLV